MVPTLVEIYMLDYVLKKQKVKKKPRHLLYTKVGVLLQILQVCIDK